jgi:hypothetical protein
MDTSTRKAIEDLAKRYPAMVVAAARRLPSPFPSWGSWIEAVDMLVEAGWTAEMVMRSAT